MLLKIGAALAAIPLAMTGVVCKAKAGALSRRARARQASSKACPTPQPRPEGATDNSRTMGHSGAKKSGLGCAAPT